MTVVLIAVPHPEPALVERLRALSPDIEVDVCGFSQPQSVRAARTRREAIDVQRIETLTDEQEASLARAEVMLVWDIPFGVGARAPNLRWVQGMSAGLDHFYGAELGSEVVVTNAAGIAAPSIAEFVLGRLLGVWKGFDQLAEQQRNHEWTAAFGRSLAGSTMVVVGLGAIGTQVIRLAKAFGVHVIGVRRRPAVDDEGGRLADEVVGTERLLEVLPRADAVVLAAPTTDETRHVIDETALAAMGDRAIVVNVARGSLIDEPALVEALTAGTIGGAILDVTEVEPLPAESPLWDLPNVWLSPHSSPVLDGYVAAVADLFVANLAAYLAGRPLRNVVDPTTVG
jgi:phosphoglycerate dehydrogenase-like enzyme